VYIAALYMAELGMYMLSPVDLLPGEVIDMRRVPLLGIPTPSENFVNLCKREDRRPRLGRSRSEAYKIRSSQAIPSSEKLSVKAASPASWHTKSLSFWSMFASR
jgi:hypothetical protein